MAPAPPALRRLLHELHALVLRLDLRAAVAWKRNSRGALVAAVILEGPREEPVPAARPAVPQPTPLPAWAPALAPRRELTPEQEIGSFCGRCMKGMPRLPEAPPDAERVLLEHGWRRNTTPRQYPYWMCPACLSGATPRPRPRRKRR